MGRRGGVPWVLGLHQFNIDYYVGILEDIAKNKSGVQTLYSHLMTMITRSRYRDDNSHPSSLTN